jgi:hypothetical protein
MSEVENSPDHLDRYIRDVSAFVGLPIDADYHAGVRKYLQISLRMAAALDAVPLQMKDDLAPVFLAE